MAVRLFDWVGTRFQTSHTPPRDATLFEGLSASGRRRVQIFGDYQMNMKRENQQYNWSPIWHYDEDGSLSGASKDWQLREINS